jgi:cobalt/nickel transport system permease protein
VLDALHRDQGIGDTTNVLCLSAHDNHFQAIVVIKMHVHRRKDAVKCIVLDIRELLVEKPHVMVVHKRHCSDYLAIWRCPSLLNELLANEISKRLGARGITPIGDVSVEFSQQIGVDCDAYPAQLPHGRKVAQVHPCKCVVNACDGFYNRATVRARAMHIPDGFLSTPVWAALDVVSAPAVGYMAKRAGSSMGEGRAPLLGVLGAFVFATQMVNFPIAPGTSGHLLGGALLAFTAGPAAASVVMTAVLVIQALVFQDGGILALGANIFNLAIAGVLAAYLPFWLFGHGRLRAIAMFTGTFLSVLVSGTLALLQILLSGIQMPAVVLSAALLFFTAGALIEGILTIVVVRGIERMNPAWIRRPGEFGTTVKVLAVASLVVACSAFVIASTQPDSLEKLAEHLGIADRATALAASPFADYELASMPSNPLGKIAAAIAGVALVYLVCVAVGKVFSRRSA